MLSRARDRDIVRKERKKEKIRNNKLQEQNAFISTINHEDGNNRKEGRETGGEREREGDGARARLEAERTLF